jgi:hypothetical protein
METLKSCRACGSSHFSTLIDLGNQYFSGYFPKLNEDISHLRAPLVLLRCEECSLVQLRDTFEIDSMYGENYGYRSGLNSSMVNHLKLKAHSLINSLSLSSKSRILDIGANDGTFLRFFSEIEAHLCAVDPTISNWLEFYDFEVEKHPILFNSTNIETLDLQKFDLISSISMYYDVPDPISFATTIKDHLSEDGIWHIELSYLPTMLKQNSYDTICHEHLEYYSLNSIMYIFDKVDLKIINIDFNDINGGSITIDATHAKSRKFKQLQNLSEILSEEKNQINNDVWEKFNLQVSQNINQLFSCVSSLNEKDNVILGLGASTKGNVILQSSGLNNRLIHSIGEINPRKFGRVTPGTEILIENEELQPLRNPDYKVVLPWHFKNHIIQKEIDFLKDGGKLIFPLPTFEIFNY